jgi:hypothetical protein
LGYAFTRKNRHKSRINVVVKHRIMVNSPEVVLCIKRSYPEVEHKKYLFLAKKAFRQILHKYKINHIKIFTL